MTDKPLPVVQRALVATDFAEPSLLAAKWATRHLIQDAELVLAHVVPILKRPAFVAQMPAEELEETMRRGAAIRLREISRDLGAQRIWLEIRRGDPAAELLAVASAYAVDVIVVGDSGRRTGVARILGNTAERVLRGADVPVLVARNLNDAPRSILVALDDSDESPHVLAWAEMLALHFSAKLTALYGVSPALSSAVQIVAAGVSAERALDGLTDSARRWLDESLASTRERIGAVTALLSFGEVGSEIVSERRRLESDLVVIGRGGAGRAAALILGSVTRYVLHADDAPVLIVPTSTRSRKPT